MESAPRDLNPILPHPFSPWLLSTKTDRGAQNSRPSNLHAGTVFGMADSKIEKIGFIGLGTMGYPMVERLASGLPRESTISVYDIATKAITQISEQHPGRVHVCSSAREVTEQSDIVISMVPEGSHVVSVYLESAEGVLAADVDRKIVIDCSTIDTATSIRVAREMSRKFPQASFYDAPVSGGVVGAEKGTLTFMVGCTEEDPNFPRLKDLLRLMGNSIFACGGQSLGLTTKLCNNYLSGLIAIASSEAMNVGIRSGLDPKLLTSIFRTSTAQNAILDKFHPVPGVQDDALSTNGYKGGFKVQLMRKDFSLAVQTAERVGAKLALGQAGLDVYTGASDNERCKDLDSRVVYRYLGGVEDWQSLRTKDPKE